MHQIIDDILVFGPEADDRAMLQIRNCRATADRVALMADHHKGYNVPIGGVVASTTHINVSGVGFDIGCGNKAARLDLKLEDVRADLPRIAEELWRTLPFGVGSHDGGRGSDDPLFDDPAWNDVAMLRDRSLRQKSRNQLGSIGSGNHYVDLFADEEDRVWIGVHFGSRGLGHTVATEFLNLAGPGPNAPMDAPPALLKLSTAGADDYLQAMTLAGTYAAAGRNRVVDTVAGIVGAPIVEEIHNHHNYAWHETHGGEAMWVVRKGATPAFPGQRGFVGGSMGDVSVILEGVESDLSAQAMYSTVHGAGRVMSRTKAAGKFRQIKGRRVHQGGGAVDMDIVRRRIHEAGIILKGAGADEAPEVYRRLPEVVAAHVGTVRILHTLRPLIVVMAGEDEFDPYKD